RANAATSMVHQEREHVVAKPFEHGGGNEVESDDDPRVSEVRRDQLLQVQGIMSAGNAEKLNVAGSGGGIQNPIKDRADQQILECVEGPHGSHKHDRRQY